ncbi:MAG: hypothetical protein ABWK05_04245 [Pyrobaculum sp.]
MRAKEVFDLVSALMHKHVKVEVDAEEEFAELCSALQKVGVVQRGVVEVVCNPSLLQVELKRAK